MYRVPPRTGKAQGIGPYPKTIGVSIGSIDVYDKGLLFRPIFRVRPPTNFLYFLSPGVSVLFWPSLAFSGPPHCLGSTPTLEGKPPETQNSPKQTRGKTNKP